MDEIREGLIALFEEMLPLIKKFNKGSYNNIFESGFEKYKHLVYAIEDLGKDMDEAEKAEQLDLIARYIPDYVLACSKKLTKKEYETFTVDYNMNMAVYVVPILTYTRNRNCDYMAKKMVEYWNEIKVSPLTLSLSSYEDIAGGFKKKLCFITTAVCVIQNKPDDCYELTTLRDYRDHYLMQTVAGQELVDEYYDIAPAIVMMINMQNDSESIYDQLNENYISKCIHLIEHGQNEECQALYTDMVRNLQKQYLYS